MRAAIVLAAGRSRRFGLANKLLVAWRGTTMLGQVLAAARAAPAARILLVTGADGARVARAGEGPRVTIVRARRHADGMAASLAAGAAALRPCEEAAFVFLADMPWLPRDLARRLVRALRPGIAAARPTMRGRPGHPVLARRAVLRALERDGGDAGLAPLLRRLPVALVPADRRCLADADRRRALRRRVPVLY